MHFRKKCRCCTSSCILSYCQKWIFLKYQPTNKAIVNCLICFWHFELWTRSEKREIHLQYDLNISSTKTSRIRFFKLFLLKIGKLVTRYDLYCSSCRVVARLFCFEYPVQTAAALCSLQKIYRAEHIISVKGKQMVAGETRK